MSRALRQCFRPRERRHLTELKTTNPKNRQPKLCRNPHNSVTFRNCCILWMTVWGSWKIGTALEPQLPFSLIMLRTMIASRIAPIERSKKLAPPSLLQISRNSVFMKTWNWIRMRTFERMILQTSSSVMTRQVSRSKTNLQKVSTPVFAWQLTKTCYRKLFKSLSDQQTFQT